MRASLWIVPFFVIPPALAASQESWPGFRGPNASGHAAAGGALPAEIGPGKNVVWKTALPPGHSSPVVHGGRIYLTAVRDQRLFTIAVDAASGKLLWESEAEYREAERIHAIGSLAQPSVATTASAS